MWKKMIAAIILMVALLAFPVEANAPVPVLVDGHKICDVGLLIDGKTYVPLRAVSESLGAKVHWTGTSAEVSSVQRPEIIGDGIQEVVAQALDLLEKHDPADYKMICREAGTIEYFGTTLTCPDGGVAYARAIPIMSRVCLGKELIEDNVRFTPAYIAGVLVHESVHVANNDKLPLPNNENMAYMREEIALIIIGAPEKFISEAERGRLNAIK